jgi:pyruvate, orthophosphate dikinase
MDAKPVTVRLLDPPLHEFLPDQVELAVAVALARQQGQAQVEVGAEALPLAEAAELLAKVNDLHEANPMLGLRGVRLGILKPGLYAMQVRAICEAAARVKAEGGTPMVEIMIPLAATREELAQSLEELVPVARQTLQDQGQEVAVLWGGR